MHKQGIKSVTPHSKSKSSRQSFKPKNQHGPEDEHSETCLFDFPSVVATAFKLTLS
jgi:hypothetical protein